MRTFTVGFAETGFDEAHHAQVVADHLGTDHTRVDLGADEAQAVIPDLATIYDEPFADSSQIATVLISRVARQDVTVCLSGDGGDELFAGYNRHRAVPRMHQRFGRLPRPMRRGAGRLAGAVPAATWDRAAELVPARRRPRLAGNKMTKVAGALTSDGPLAMYKQVVSHWHDPFAVVVGATPHDPLSDLSLDPDGDLTAQIMRLDAETYLPGDILTKVDRASMSASLEVRVPLLDRAVVEFALGLPVVGPRHQSRLEAPGARGAGPPRPAGVDRPAEDGLRCACRPVDPGTPAGLGRGPARPAPPRPGGLSGQLSRSPTSGASTSRVGQTGPTTCGMC